MKVTYAITLNDIKETCSEAVNVLSPFKKRRILFSLTFPFVSLLFLFLPFFELLALYAVIPIAMIYYYFYGYAQDILFTSLKKQRYKHSPKDIEIELTLDENLLIVKQSAITRKINPEAIISKVEKEDKYILFLSEDTLDFIIIKKSPKNLTPEDIQNFNKLLQKYI
ncbi:hypothetical protein [Desemzia sp. FAM 23991]|uniref:hypothetical protein n=1 Tax=unclassified Desemzia TaxID=2685243 RepID=UPI003883A217